MTAGQEPEDVARQLRAVVEQFCDDWNLPNDADHALDQLVTRLVRAGQRRELEVVAKECCPGCERDTPRKGPFHDGAPPITLDIHGSGRGLCRALPIHARLALLREE